MPGGTKSQACTVASGYFPSWLYPEESKDENPNDSHINSDNDVTTKVGSKRFKQTVYRLLNLNECWVEDTANPRQYGGLMKHIDTLTDTSGLHSDSNVSYMKFTSKPAQRTSSSGADSGVGLSEKDSKKCKDDQIYASHKQDGKALKSTSKLQISPKELCLECGGAEYSDVNPNGNNTRELDLIDGELQRLDIMHNRLQEDISRSMSRTSRCV